MEPVIEFMRSKGVQVGDVYKIIVGHPPVLSYAPEHLNKFWVREAFKTVPDLPHYLRYMIKKGYTVPLWLYYIDWY